MRVRLDGVVKRYKALAALAGVSLWTSLEKCAQSWPILKFPDTRYVFVIRVSQPFFQKESFQPGRAI